MRDIGRPDRGLRASHSQHCLDGTLQACTYLEESQDETELLLEWDECLHDLRLRGRKLVGDVDELQILFSAAIRDASSVCSTFSRLFAIRAYSPRTSASSVDMLSEPRYGLSCAKIGVMSSAGALTSIVKSSIGSGEPERALYTFAGRNNG